MSADQELAQTGVSAAVGITGGLIALVVGTCMVLWRAIAQKAAGTRK